VTGGGIAVPRFHQLFLLARQQGHGAPQDWAQFVWKILVAQGQRLVKDGKAIEVAADNLAELTQQAHTFAEKQLHMPERCPGGVRGEVPTTLEPVQDR